MEEIILSLILSDIVLFVSCAMVESHVKKHSQANRINHLVGVMSILILPVLLLAFIWV